MNQDYIDDSGQPFEPETPEAFFQRGEEAFQIWWDEFDPPGSSGGLELDYETARVVWSAAYEHSANCIMLVYDGAEANADGAHPTGEMQLACVVDHHHNGNISFPSRDFFNWVAQHEDHIRRDYSEDEQDADPGTVTVWIDHAGQSPSTSVPIKRPPATSSEDLRATADKEFARWWKRLNPPGTLAYTNLDRDESQVVWREAFVRLWEELEVVHDSAKAYAEVVAETAWLELAYIIDRFHNGKLSFAVIDVMKYWNENEYVLERHRTEEVIFFRVLRVNQDRDR
ncbi:MAG: hypothetical protein H8E44_13575 [Planctomycetes bacterium]|nr:hypothetical protein [Planctomycetota bacterium]